MSSSASSIRQASLGNRERKPSETLRHCSWALCASGWAKTVRMVAPPSVELPWGPGRESVPHEVHPTPLPRGSYQCGLDGALQASVRVAGDQPHPREPPGDQRAQKRCPECPIFAGAHVEAQHLPLAGLCVHPHGYDHRCGGHPTVLAGLDVSGVDPDVGIGTFQRPASEALDLLIELLAQLRDPALTDAAHPQRLYQLIHLAGGDAVDVGFLDNCCQGSLGPPSRLEERGEVAAVSYPEAPSVPRSQPSCPRSAPCSRCAVLRVRGCARDAQRLRALRPPSP